MMVLMLTLNQDPISHIFFEQLSKIKVALNVSQGAWPPGGAVDLKGLQLSNCMLFSECFQI